MNFTKLIIIASFILILNILLFKGGILEYFNYKSYDILSGLVEQQKDAKSSVVVVDIDEKSLDALGQWPWSRVILAKLISQINSAKPASIGIDIIFPEIDKTSPVAIKKFYKNYFSLDLSLGELSSNLLDNDILFADALSSAKVALALYLNDGYSKRATCKIAIDGLRIKNDSSVKYNSRNILCNIETIQKSGSAFGFINASVDKDGIFRRLPLFMKYNGTIIPALSIATMMGVDNVVLDEKSMTILGKSIKLGQNSEVLLKFYDNSWYKKVSVIDILTNNIEKGIFKGKFVLIGTSAAGLYDRFMTSNGKNMARIDAHSTIIDNILLGDLVYELESIKIVNFILVNLFLFWLLYLMFKRKYICLLSGFVGIILLFFLISYISLLNGVYIANGFFLPPLIVGFFVINFITIILSYLEKGVFNKEISKAHTSAIDSMALVVESRDTETGAHIKRTKEYVKLLCEHMIKNNVYKNTLNKEFAELVYRASPLHDIGKVGIPDYVLKKPAKLSFDEFEIIKTHSTIGKDILKNALVEHSDNKFLAMAKNIAHSHHEKWDGSGYPDGLSGLNIPLEARMMALADVYDALISRRIYKESFNFEVSENIIIAGKGTHFDNLIVDAFIEIKDKFKEVALKIREA